jgi:hypothetical protein
MKVELLLNDYNGQVSLMSESVVETRVNLNIARLPPDNMTHVSHEDPRVAIVRDDDQRVKTGPPYPSVRLPHDTTLWAIHGWPMHYPLYT